MNNVDVIKTLKNFKKQNGNRYNILKIGVFGSAARNELNSQSDIDVVVVLEKPDMFDLIGIKHDLEEMFNRRVDIVRYRDDMNSFLKRQIEREAIYA